MMIPSGKFDFPPDRYAVIGNPIEHSKSPLIHTYFAQQTQQNIIYEKILAPLDGFVKAVQEFVIAGGKGLNVTIPFKIEASKLATQLASHAQQAAAVNTLSFNNTEIIGDNTDGIGLVRDLLVNQKQPIQDQRVLLMGAGGAARGVLAVLLEKSPKEFVIANRTLERAQQLAQQYSDQIEACCFDVLDGRQFDLVINATASSMQDQVPILPTNIYAANALAYDMMYSTYPTIFMQYAQAQGAARVSDGLGMLVEQAAESFYLWRGIRPNTSLALAQLRLYMKS